MLGEDIAVLNALIIAATVFVTYRGFRSESLVEKYIFSTERILGHREYYRLFSSALVHADWIHLLFNVYSLYSFGSWIERIFGPWRFALVYFSGILGGSLLALLLHRRHEYRALGASGGVCGVIFASIFLLPGGSVMVFPIPFAIPAWAYAILFMGYSFFGMRSQRDNIGHDAHLGGAVVGLGVATALEPSIVRASPILYFAVIGLSGAGFLYLYAYPQYSHGRKPFRMPQVPKLWAQAREKKRRELEAADEETLERLLEQISRDGMTSLTMLEKMRLERIRRRRQRSGRN